LPSISSCRERPFSLGEVDEDGDETPSERKARRLEEKLVRAEREKRAAEKVRRLQKTLRKRHISESIGESDDESDSGDYSLFSGGASLLGSDPIFGEDAKPIF
jgi:hypothetical protein